MVKYIAFSKDFLNKLSDVLCERALAAAIFQFIIYISGRKFLDHLKSRREVYPAFKSLLLWWMSLPV